MFNGRDHLVECFSSLAGQTRPADEVLALDNASSDGSLELIRAEFPSVRTVRLDSNHGYAGGCNAAARILATDVVVFLNQDVRVDPNWLEELIRPLETDPTVTASQSLILLYEAPTLVNTSGTTVNFLGVGWVSDYRKPAQSIKARDVNFLSGTAFAIRRQAFLDIGAFDEAYGSYHEDVDLSWRMLLLGLRARLAPASHVYHKYVFTRPGPKNFWLERNRLLTVAKNYRGATLALILPAMLLSELGICALATAQGWIGRKLAAYRDLIRLMPHVTASRRSLTRQRRVPDRKIARALAGGLDFEELRQPIVRAGSAFLSGYWWLIKWLVRW